MNNLTELNVKIEKSYNTLRTWEDKMALMGLLGQAITLANNPTNADNPARLATLLNAYNLRAGLYTSDEDDKALSDIDKIIALTPYDSAAYHTKALLLANLPEGRRNPQEIIALHDHSISLKMKGNTSYYYRGLEKSVLGDNKGAIADFTICINKDLMAKQAHLQRGHCYSKLKEYNDAIHDYNIVLARVKYFPEVLEMRAAAKYAIKDYDGASKDCQKIIDDNVQNYTIWNLLGDCRDKLGDLKGAEAAYTEVLEHDWKAANIDSAKEKIAAVREKGRDNSRFYS